MLMKLVAITLAIQGFAVLIIASACMWNFRRLAEISRAVTRIENEIGMDVGRQKIECIRTGNRRHRIFAQFRLL